MTLDGLLYVVYGVGACVALNLLLAIVILLRQR